MSARKAPQCRKCYQPMRGHKADFCSVSPSPGPKMKEEEDAASQSSALYLSPPPSPPPPSDSPSLGSSSSNGTARHRPVPLVSAHREYTPDIMSEASFIIPDTGYFHRRNPNFEHILGPQVMNAPLATGSLAPTEIIGSEGGRTVTPSVRSASPTASDWRQTSRSGRSDSGEIYRGLGGLFAVQATPLRGGHVDRMHGGAGNSGLHTAVMMRPGTFGGARAKAWAPTGPNMDAIAEFIDTARVEAMDSRVMHFIYELFAFAPLFMVCLTASVLGGYICKTYL
ncbi:hypothetical protein GALMADRAFT_262448 [Galerina marginata CBS 339.88]|uniref:Uncharacterized protein n=1 Tax=Galerina marginata (strain CBS 339.88) TaxID=685588 RepID=A0A067TVX7_GALM3|nr:hypothetical protein GALMADRAFT_262448 [Galerina marginata CBS 339.88]